MCVCVCVWVWVWVCALRSPKTAQSAALPMLLRESVAPLYLYHAPIRPKMRIESRNTTSRNGGSRGYVAKLRSQAKLDQPPPGARGSLYNT